MRGVPEREEWRLILLSVALTSERGLGQECEEDRGLPLRTQRWEGGGQHLRKVFSKLRLNKGIRLEVTPKVMASLNQLLLVNHQGALVNNVH